MEFIIVKTTVESKKDAEDLAKKIIEAKLGACVQISEIKSIYKWKGKIENNKEFKIEIKTSSQNYKKLQEFIIKNHKYELPEIIAIKIIAGYNKYLNWITKN
ncbi:MAG: divalent-cation tolerance protein CutA [Nanoarchaeota archaeon]